MSEVFSDDHAESVDSWDLGHQEPSKRQKVSCVKSTFEKIEKVVLDSHASNRNYLVVSNNPVQLQIPTAQGTGEQIDHFMTDSGEEAIRQFEEQPSGQISADIHLAHAASYTK